jgi:hypothetical protein
VLLVMTVLGVAVAFALHTFSTEGNSYAWVAYAVLAGFVVVTLTVFPLMMLVCTFSLPRMALVSVVIAVLLYLGTFTVLWLHLTRQEGVTRAATVSFWLLTAAVAYPLALGTVMLRYCLLEKHSLTITTITTITINTIITIIIIIIRYWNSEFGSNTSATHLGTFLLALLLVVYGVLVL